MDKIGFRLYLLFTVSWFTHLTSRLPILAHIRFDLLLIVLLLLIGFFSYTKERDAIASSQTGKILTILICYIIFSLPFVEWPGSILKSGILVFGAAIIFYYLTVIFVTTEHRLKTFLYVFLLCQCIRGIEPLYLHISEGYWGSQAYMDSGEFLNRLSGSPHDVVNPNGLAFIIVMIIPFIHFLRSSNTWHRIAYLILLPSLLSALYLTGSRSGLIALFVVIIGIFFQSRRKILLVVGILVGSLIAASYLDTNLDDRYLSIISKSSEHSGTAAGRITGLKNNLKVAKRRPLFGHGLGTSQEANFNFGNNLQPAHNLYIELLQELGLIGLIIFILYIKSILKTIWDPLPSIHKLEENNFLLLLNKGLKVFIVMNIVFSFASYGVTGYEWYLFAGISVVNNRLLNSAVA